MSRFITISFAVFAFLFAPEIARGEALQFKPNLAQSSIQVDVKATVDSFVGALTVYDLQLSVDKASGAVESCSFEFDFNALDTGKKKRNEQMLEWLGYNTHPKGVFKLIRLEDTSDGRRALGTLAIHGVTKEIEFPITLKRDGEHLLIDGRAHLDYHDFGLETIRVMLMLTVDPKFDVILHLEGDLVAPN
jgi:polyisoprenoid-binding protein YceI